jgi:hypothetical protein
MTNYAHVLVERKINASFSQMRKIIYMKESLKFPNKFKQTNKSLDHNKDYNVG